MKIKTANTYANKKYTRIFSDDMICIRICCFSASFADKTTDTYANKKILLAIFLANYQVHN